jgi:ABC-type multidrug transport system fused ATPase/permease subunit
MRRRGGGVLLMRHLAPQRRALAHIAAWSLVESLPALTSGLLVAAALDHGFLDRRPLQGLGWLSLLGVTLVVRAFATRRLYPWLGETVEPLRDGLVRDLVTAAVLRGVAEPGEPDVAGVARLTEQVESVRQLVTTLLHAVRQVGFVIFASLAGLAALSPVVAVLVAPPLFLALAIYAVCLRSLSTRERSVVLAGETIPQAAGAVLSGVRDVVACRAEHRAAAMVGETIDREARARQALARAGAVRTLVIVVGAQLPVFVILLAAPWLIKQHGLSIGAVAGAITYVTTSLEPALRSLVQVTGTWGLQLAVVLGRLAETCALPARPAAAVGPAPPEYHVEVDRLTFAYGPHSEPVIYDLSLKLRHGEYLAVVGPSGVGKSTLANLLAGLLRPQRGQVCLGGIPLENLDEVHLRRAIALIPQEAYVFAGTLRENLTYLRPHASDGELDQAAEAIGLGPTVERLGGYHALIGAGGVSLSAGERQLIALTRVYLSSAEIMLLDEATCHLDPITEAHAEQAFAARGGTLVVIAHRISSALRAERILLMDGATPLLGTHQSLLAVSPLYADLVGNWDPTVQRPLSTRL